jgi:hypothetical protein
MPKYVVDVSILCTITIDEPINIGEAKEKAMSILDEAIQKVPYQVNSDEMEIYEIEQVEE